jgi:hypothetical protein
MKQTMELHKRWKDDPSKGEVFTPIELVREMLDKIPLSVWENPESKFLDPCMGKGTFLIEIINRLVYIYGYSKEDAVSRVYGYDVCVKYVNYLKRGGLKNVFHKDFLNEEFSMKFDVVIGNPPYQSGNNKSNKLWVKFISKSLELSENLCFVVPLSLMISESKQITDIRKKLSNKQNTFNLTKKDIFNVGEKVVYFTSIGSNSNESIIIFPDNTIKKINNLIGRQPIEVKDNLKLLIFDKIENFPYKNEYVYDFNFNSNKTTPKRLIEEQLVSEIEDDEIFKYRVHHSASKTLYSRVLVSNYSQNNESTYGKLKVVLNYSGGFVGERYMFLSTNLIGKQMLGILVDNENEGNNLINLYSSKLFNWYINSEKSGGFNTGIFKLPKMDKTKLWTNSEIYNFFKLTKEEIEYIEFYDI